MARSKTLLWLLLSTTIAFFTLRTIFHQNRALSLSRLFQLLAQSSFVWLSISFLCMFGFILFEGLSLQYALRRLGFPVALYQGILYSAGDQFFSAITPSASGGQPASALFMRSDHIPAATVTVCLLANLIMYTTSTMSIGLACILLQPGLLANFSRLSRLLVLFGYFALIALSAIFLLLLKKTCLLRHLISSFFRFLHQIHLLRDLETCEHNLDKYLEEYRLCAKMLENDKSVFLMVFIFDLAQRISQISVTVTLHLALRPGQYLKAKDLWIVQTFSQIGSNFVPIPGGMGAADYLMLDGFRTLFPKDYAFLLQTLSRSFSFYLCTFISGLVVLIGFLKKRRKNNVPA